MKTFTYRALSFLFAVGAVLILILAMTGCSIDPATGKSVFDPAKAQSVANSPEASAVASTIPYGLGGLALAGASILFGVLGKQSKDKHAATTELITHAVTAAAGALQADSGVAINNGSNGTTVTLPPAVKA